ncbi:VTC domain-containing protein [Hyalangium rubrum]|uniref:VTC domain-containing protein n=1 Tax=Hyalangium rubrum TaxID=3103134 RepID=A0ABU5H7Y2_9BACT|nr:VTC domain-containing protein [Hyalangium sp. s54d21]MDY7229583.1 VTC domain-containing protein [Hyalangium sp. s54d21]
MSALAYTGSSSMEHSSPELDHERRFQPPREAVEDFLCAVGPFTEPLVYALDHPYAFTRTTYFDTEELDLLGSRGSGLAQRLRLREYAGAAQLTDAPILTGVRYLELKISTGERRMKARCLLSAEEANALLSGDPLPESSPASALLRQSTLGPVKPWVMAWYRRTTHMAPLGLVRITLDEELTFALPPTPGGAAAPTQVLQRASVPLLEVKWLGRGPSWLEKALQPLEHSETQGSKFEQGMRALFGGTRLLPGSR